MAAATAAASAADDGDDRRMWYLGQKGRLVLANPEPSTHDPLMFRGDGLPNSSHGEATKVLVFNSHTACRVAGRVKYASSINGGFGS